jgi:hypothetical protein
VGQVDSLVAGAMKRLAETFATERAKLEGQWDREENVSTENLRLALRRYRSFFGTSAFGLGTPEGRNSGHLI